MRKAKKSGRADRLRGAAAVLATATFLLATSGCDGLLDVENPNSVKQADIENPTAAGAVVAGAMGTVTRGVLAMWGPYSTLTDEVLWIGSRNAWNSLDFGFVDAPFNEFTNSAFQSLGEGRWMADEAIELVSGFYEDEALQDTLLLAQAYLAGAIVYVTIGDQFESYAFSDRTESGEPVPSAQMDSVYRVAISYLDQGLAVANQISSPKSDSLVLAIRALRARARYGLGVWNVLQGSLPAADPYVTNAQMIADASYVIQNATSDWRYQLVPANLDVAIYGEVSLAYNVNQRPELQISDIYAELSADQEDVEGTALTDPIDGVPDPVLDTRIDEFLAGGALAPYTVVSWREMHLILAEAALAGGSVPGGGFAAHINAVRALDELTAFDPGNATHPDDQDMLIHERRVNLFLQGRRLADMYRFGIESPLWQSESMAIQQPGTFFPITITECRANSFIGEDNCG